jgi:putative ABC transport system permease protein
METLIQDLRYGVRILLKERALTIVAVLALTLGIGANTAIFSVINAVLIRPLPYPQSARLMRIYEKSPDSEISSVSYPNFLDWRQQSETFEDMSTFRAQGFNITGNQGPERVPGNLVSGNLFSVLRIQPVVGRSFLPEEDRPGGSPVAVISYGLWQRRFGGDQNVVGEPLMINGKAHTLVGVLPASFSFYSPSDVFIPIGSQNNPTLQARALHVGINVVGRLKAGASIEQARAEMESIAAALAKQYPDSNQGYSAVVSPMHEDLVGDVKPLLFVLLGAVGFVLLIACANVANLMLARAASRQKEMAVRAALGGSRARIIRQLLAESVLLAIISGAHGLLLALWGTSALTAAIPTTLPRAAEIGIDYRVLLFTLGISLLTGLIFGLAPAWQASKPNLNESLKEGGRVSADAGHYVRRLLVISEVALALVLLIGAGLMIRSLLHLRSISPGINPKNVLTMKIPLLPSTYNEAAKIRNFYQQLLERTNGVSGVEAAGITADMPLTGAESQVQFWLGGGARPAPDAMKAALFCPTSAGYAEAMGIQLLQGRFIGPRDLSDSPKVAVIDENLARGLFPNEDPVGKQLSIKGFFKLPDLVCEIVGVVNHVKHLGLDVDSQQKVQYQIYYPYTQVPDLLLPKMVDNITLVARTQSDPMAIAPDVKNQVLALDKDQPVNNIRTMEQIVSTSIAQQRFSLLLLGIFAGIALTLAAVGVYGVMNYTVAQRTQELGIRMALGARPGDVLRLIVGQGMTLAVIGVALGLVAAFALTRLMASLLFGVSASDPATFMVVAILLVAVALAACFIPARRATKVDPMIALRYE